MVCHFGRAPKFLEILTLFWWRPDFFAAVAIVHCIYYDGRALDGFEAIWPVSVVPCNHCGQG